MTDTVMTDNGMTAKQLIALAAACTSCGVEHKPHQTESLAASYAAPDGHPYRARIYQLTNSSGVEIVKALRELAGELDD
jgi:hypothetical protein